MVLNVDASHGSGRAGETFVPPQNSKNDAKCDDVKFEGRVTRLSRKHQLEASSEPSTKRHRTSNATYYGRIEDSLDAGIVIEACIKGILREVSGAMEVSSIEIRSGTVLVIHERDGNIHRWRDGYHWSPSRISTGFLIYRQVERNDVVPTTEAEAIQTTPSTADGSKLAKGKSFTVLPNGLTKKTIGMIGSDRQSYRVISYYETEDARVRTSLINIRELDSPRISAHKALLRPSKDESFSSLGLYPKNSDESTILSGWRNKRKRRAVLTPQIDRRYPEYEPQMSDYPIMFPYRNDPVATDDSQARPSTTEKFVHPKEVSNGQPSSLLQKRTPTALAPQFSRAIAVEQYLYTPALLPLVACAPSANSNTYRHQGDTLHYSLSDQYDAYQGMTGGFMSQQQQYQQQYILGPGYFQPPSGYGPRPPPSNGHYPL
ncbi:Gti1/Pac2 family-domain-containing protein [Chytriomyces cf. hyalinus JEL632]|nr:Gti1/Pac2 family-domain-containing protein [Chytriomyces cf. hyalinus JEL632]